MNRVSLEYSTFHEAWSARVGDAGFTGTREECLRWMTERFAECKDLAREIRKELMIATFEDSPFAYSPGE